jgi:ABC-type transport system involved in multi-copper enzyme maturation permease subunit
MTVLWPIALITFKEGIRNRAIYGITIIALLLLGANFFISGMIMQEVGKVAVDMALSTVSFSGLLLVLFVGINLMAKDLDKRTIYMVLSRPISRSQYIVGKFFGMCLLIMATIIFLSLFASASILMLKMAYPNYFPRFSWSLVFLALSFIFLTLMLLSSLSFLFSSFTSTSFITLVLTVISYVIGQSLGEVKALVEAPQAVGIHVSPVTVKIVQVAFYLFPNLSLFDIKVQAAHGLSLTSSYIFWVIIYGLVYTSLQLLSRRSSSGGGSFLMRRFIVGIVLLILIPVHIFALGKVTEQGKLLSRGENSTFVLPSPILRITALDFRGIASDFMFLKALVFIGSTFERQERPRVKAWEWHWLYHTLEASVALDPYF